MGLLWAKRLKARNKREVAYATICVFKPQLIDNEVLSSLTKQTINKRNLAVVYTAESKR